MATIRNAETLHANHGDVKFAGQKIGRLQNLQFTRDTGADYVYELGEFNPVEINHNRGSYRATATSLILRRRAGNAVVNKLGATLGDVEPFDIEFIDRDTGTLMIASGCEPVGDSVTIPLNQRVNKNVQLMALNIRPAAAGRSSQATAA
jgi:hypothetical protein